LPNLNESFLLDDCRQFFFAIAELDFCGLAEASQLFGLDVCQVPLPGAKCRPLELPLAFSLTRVADDLDPDCRRG
jgi:hypothetical protein